MLTNQQKSRLKGLAHHLKPVVMIGNAGLSENVIQAIEEALEHHELIKVKISGADRDTRDALVEKIGGDCSAEKVQRVGNIATFYRRNNKKPVINV